MVTSIAARSAPSPASATCCRSEVLQLEALSKAAAKGDVEALRQAKELEARSRVLSSFDEGPDLVLFYKHMMVLKGNPEYSCTSTRPTRCR